MLWTDEEHAQFLQGLQKYGKGDWRSISRHYVRTRTPTQARSPKSALKIRTPNPGPDNAV